MAIRPPEDPQQAPVMPSFASLRDPRRRTAVDVLMTSGPTGRPPAARPPAAASPRPPEWSDLLLLGRHVARSSVRCLARLFGLSEGSATLRR